MLLGYSIAAPLRIKKGRNHANCRGPAKLVSSLRQQTLKDSR